jgi:hypothetical protein
VWTALHTTGFYPHIPKDNSILAYRNNAGSGSNPEDGSDKMGLPMWLVYAYLGSNTILNFLNIYWFAKMIQALRKRFQHSNVIIKERSPGVDVRRHVD